MLTGQHHTSLRIASISSNTNIYGDCVLFVISLHLMATLAGPSFNREDSQTLTWRRDQVNLLFYKNVTHSTRWVLYRCTLSCTSLHTVSQGYMSVIRCADQPRRGCGAGKERSVSERDNQRPTSRLTRTSIRSPNSQIVGRWPSSQIMRNWENLVTNGFRLTHFGSSRRFYDRCADICERGDEFQDLSSFSKPDF